MVPHRTPSRRSGRLLLSGLALTAATSLLQPAGAASASPKPAPQEYLVAADPAAKEVYVYRTSDMRRTGHLDDVVLGAHVGTVQLPDGRLLMVDDAHAKVLAVKISSKGKPTVVGSAAIPARIPWQRAAWAAVDKNHQYLAVSSDYEGAASQTITLVNLKSFATKQITVPLKPTSAGTYGEAQVYLAGDPLQVVVTTGEEFTSFPVAPILAGQSPAATSTAPLGANHHGPVVSRTGNRVFSTTADGLDGAALPGATLTQPVSVTYSHTRNVIQNFRPRLAADNATIWGVATEDTGLDATQWADTRNDVSIINTTSLRSDLVRLPDGSPNLRFALSAKYGAVTVANPEGDTLSLIDTAPRSSTYKRLVGVVALPSLSGGPVAGTAVTGTQARFTTLTSSGDRAYVSQGGEGKILVIDTGSRAIQKSVSAPTSLTGGGYLTVVKTGTPLSDLIAR
ncbi:MAG TPA: hypothetical protein VLL08_18285 [Kineosporiaceae bacterium]|nr:hypothetical protein [Kineosporiaceae bacterium]